MKKIITRITIWTARASLFAALLFGVNVLTISGSASAQTVTYPSELNIPYGRSYRDENTPYIANSRSGNGNRLIINGRILTGTGSTLSGGLGNSFFGSQYQSGGGGGSAIGNQLNVITNGSWNTVIIDNTQINNGNQTVNSSGLNNDHFPPIAEDHADGVELNGEINLND